MSSKWWLAGVLIACVLLMRTTHSDPSSEWTNLYAQWSPQGSSSAYRFRLPDPGAVTVTLVKPTGGSHNRVWSMQVAQGTGPVSLPVRSHDEGFFGRGPWQAAERPLTERHFVGSNDGFRADPAPGLWARRHGRVWQFLTYQDLNAPYEGPKGGPIEITPRAQLTPGIDCEFGEGYFTWEPGQVWHPCGPNGD